MVAVLASRRASQTATRRRDNLEWTSGFGSRFGLISVDFDTLERTPKLSADWFRAAARRNAVVKMILLFILVWGMFAGWIAHLLLARSQPVNWAELLIIGLAGSFVGGLLISLVSGDGLALRPSGIIGSILGAVILLAAWQAVRGGARGRSR